MGSVERRSRHHRKAASVLPLPVGAAINTWRPAATSLQPLSWTFVGAAKAERNQSRAGCEKRSRAVPIGESVNGSGDANKCSLTGGTLRSARDRAAQVSRGHGQL